MSYDHILDPSGDVVFTLDNPDAPLTSSTSPRTDEVDTPETKKRKRSVTFLVSSRHLSLASPVLKAALSGPWTESAVNTSDGLRHIDTEEWDTTAMTIFMAIVHGQWAKVPESVDLVLLCKIAVIVDYYQAHNAVAIVSSAYMRQTLITTYQFTNDSSILGLCVSWIFQDAPMFKKAIDAAIRTHVGPMEYTQLPVPSKIIDKINEQILQIQRRITEEMNTLARLLLHPLRDSTCSTVQLGALMKAMSFIGVPWLQESELSSFTSFRNFKSVQLALPQIRGMAAPQWYEHQRTGFGVPSSQSAPGLLSSYSRHTCSQCTDGSSLVANRQRIAEQIEKLAVGLDLETFKDT